MVTILEKIENFDQDDDYLLLHETIRLKQSYNNSVWQDEWESLTSAGKIAFLISLSSIEISEMSDFLIQCLYTEKGVGVRHALVKSICRFPGIVAYVQPFCILHKELSVPLQREVEWFLAATNVADAVQFFIKLKQEGLMSPYGDVNTKENMFEAIEDRINSLVAKFHGYYLPVDKWAIWAWLKQFGGSEDILLMLALLERMLFVNSDMIVQASGYLWKSLPEYVRKRAFVTGLGVQCKSGTHILFEFRPSGFARKQRVADLSTILRQNGDDPLLLVFVDDMIGTGNQAVRFYYDTINQNKPCVKLRDEEILRLKKAEKHYLSVVGFRDGINVIKESEIFSSVQVWRELADENKAFSEACSEFESLNDLRVSKQLALFYGNHLYPDVKEGGEKIRSHPLGYGATEALVSFYYNTPNNTLPIIWQRGRIGYQDWVPLLPRRE